MELERNNMKKELQARLLKKFEDVDTVESMIFNDKTVPKDIKYMMIKWWNNLDNKKEFIKQIKENINKEFK